MSLERLRLDSQCPCSSLPWDITDAKRVAEQLVVNEPRQALNAGDRLAAFHQLELAGMCEAAIARDTATKREMVKATPHSGEIKSRVRRYHRLRVDSW